MPIDIHLINYAKINPDGDCSTLLSNKAELKPHPIANSIHQFLGFKLLMNLFIETKNLDENYLTIERKIVSFLEDVKDNQSIRDFMVIYAKKASERERNMDKKLIQDFLKGFTSDLEKGNFENTTLVTKLFSEFFGLLSKQVPNSESFKEFLNSQVGSQSSFGKLKEKFNEIFRLIKKPLAVFVKTQLQKDNSQEVSVQSPEYVIYTIWKDFIIVVKKQLTDRPEIEGLSVLFENCIKEFSKQSDPQAISAQNSFSEILLSVRSAFSEILNKFVYEYFIEAFIDKASKKEIVDNDPILDFMLLCFFAHWYGKNVNSEGSDVHSYDIASVFRSTLNRYVKQDIRLVACIDFTNSSHRLMYEADFEFKVPANMIKQRITITLLIFRRLYKGESYNELLEPLFEFLGVDKSLIQVETLLKRFEKVLRKVLSLQQKTAYARLQDKFSDGNINLLVQNFTDIINRSLERQLTKLDVELCHDPRIFSDLESVSEAEDISVLNIVKAIMEKSRIENDCADNIKISKPVLQRINHVINYLEESNRINNVSSTNNELSPPSTEVNNAEAEVGSNIDFEYSNGSNPFFQ